MINKHLICFLILGLLITFAKPSPQNFLLDLLSLLGLSPPQQTPIPDTSTTTPRPTTTALPPTIATTTTSSTTTISPITTTTLAPKVNTTQPITTTTSIPFEISTTLIPLTSSTTSPTLTTTKTPTTTTTITTTPTTTSTTKPITTIPTTISSTTTTASTTKAPTPTPPKTPAVPESAPFSDVLQTSIFQPFKDVFPEVFQTFLTLSNNSLAGLSTPIFLSLGSNIKSAIIVIIDNVCRIRNFICQLRQDIVGIVSQIRTSLTSLNAELMTFAVTNNFNLTVAQEILQQLNLPCILSALNETITVINPTNGCLVECASLSRCII